MAEWNFFMTDEKMLAERWQASRWQNHPDTDVTFQRRERVPAPAGTPAMGPLTCAICGEDVPDPAPRYKVLGTTFWAHQECTDQRQRP